jgi:hypothetical protein
MTNGRIGGVKRKSIIGIIIVRWNADYWDKEKAQE